MSRLRDRVRPQSGEEGFSLIELLVVLGLFSVLIALLTSASALMFKDVRRQQGQSDTLDAGRRVVAVLDKQVRYANAVNTPSTAADGSQYVEWRQVEAATGQQTCVQWRWYAPGKRLEYRTGKPDATGTVLALSGWNVRADGVIPEVTASGTAVPVFALPASAEVLVLARAQLTVRFQVERSIPPVRTSTQVSLTALNTASAERLLVAVCPGVPRA